MSVFKPRRFPLITLACVSLLSNPEWVLACAVCFGDPDSDMTQGAKAGILILLGVVGTVLAGIAGMALFWIRRARTLQAQGALDPEMLPRQSMP